MLMMRRRLVQPDQRHMGRRELRRSRAYTYGILICSLLLGNPAAACLCSCPALAQEAKSAAVAMPLDRYVEVYSGVVVSAERVDEPVAAAASVFGDAVEDRGHWIRVKILVLRVWKGATPTVATAWVPVLANCDSPPLLGSYFVSMTREESGRHIASNSACDCGVKVAATLGRGTYALPGVGILVVATGLTIIVFVVMSRMFVSSARKRRAKT